MRTKDTVRSLTCQALFMFFRGRPETMAKDMPPTQAIYEPGPKKKRRLRPKH